MKIKQFIYILYLTTGFLAGLAYTYASSLVNGEDLALSIRNAIPPENILIEASMQVTQKNRKRIQTALTIETKLLGQDEFLTTYKTKPESNSMVWQIRRKVGEQNAYSCEPEENSNIHVGIANSSFTLADFGLEFLHWPSQKTIRKQRRKSRLCNVLESRPIKSIKGKYSRVLSWVDEKSGAIIAADFFDVNGELLKRFSVKGLTKKNGQWKVDELEMRDLNEGSKSRLKLNY
ncbi:MAG: outer membrane lipoprotein-sorting protein [Verrucomicrobiota bacterium]|nr:outer membrane lipoprotein-sorting protein [Verrucomicrobiota bacterium]